MAAILAVHGSSLDDSALGHLRALSLSCQAAVKLRCSDQNAARLQIETERWQRDREQRDDDRAQALQQRQRDALAAPIWAGFKKIERIRQFGPSAAVKFVFDILEEIETCKDPAHFESKVAAQMNQPGWLEKLAAEPPEPATPLQAVMNDIDQIDAYLKRKMREPKTHAAKPRPHPGGAGSLTRPPSPRPREKGRPHSPPARPIHPVQSQSAVAGPKRVHQPGKPAARAEILGVRRPRCTPV